MKKIKKNTLYIVYEELLKLINTKIIFSPATHGKILEEKYHFFKMVKFFLWKIADMKI